MRRFNLILSVAFSFGAVVVMAQPGDTPPNAQPGKCYAKCMIPDQYETVTEQMEVKGASVKYDNVPAEYSMNTEQVMVKAPSKRIIAVPATYETATEQVVVKPEGKRDRKSTRLNSSHVSQSRMPSSA